MFYILLSVCKTQCATTLSDILFLKLSDALSPLQGAQLCSSKTIPLPFISTLPNHHILLHFLKSNDEKMPRGDQYFFIDSKG